MQETILKIGRQYPSHLYVNVFSRFLPRTLPDHFSILFLAVHKIGLLIYCIED